MTDMTDCSTLRYFLVRCKHSVHDYLLQHGVKYLGRLDNLQCSLIPINWNFVELTSSVRTLSFSDDFTIPKLWRKTRFVVIEMKSQR